MEDYFRKMWAQGDSGVDIPVNVLRAGSAEISIETVIVRYGTPAQPLPLMPGG